MGQLSRYDMEKEYEMGGLKIIPFLEPCKKAASYDLTPTIIAMSAKVGMLEKVYREPHFNEDRYYILVHPKDTVLIVSNEYIIVPENIAGYVSSRVSKLVDGFGHISTTIDPNWSGAALIALSNPSNQPLKVYVGTKFEENYKQNQLATVTFHYLNSACTKDDIDSIHKGMRLDLLNKVMYKNKIGIRAFFRKIFYFKRKEFTDYFFATCELKYEKIDEKKWKEFLKEFSCLTDLKSEEDMSNKMSRKARKRAVDFVVTENVFTRTFYLIQRRKELVNAVFVLVLLVLIYLGIIPETVLECLVNIIQNILLVNK